MDYIDSFLLLGKLTRSEEMRDSIMIEALNESLQKPDTPNTTKDS